MQSVLSIILTICMVFGSTPAILAEAYNNPQKNYSSATDEKLENFDYSKFNFATGEYSVADSVYYVALGDSISTGFGLDGYDSLKGSTRYNVDSFVNKLEKSLNNKEIINMAVDGLDTNDFLKSLRRLKLDLSSNSVYKKCIEQASVITLTIGGNNILNPIVNAINKKMEESKVKMTVSEALVAVLKSESLSTNLISDINKNMKSFVGTESLNYEDGEFQQIIHLIKEINSHADIVVQTIYNPYKNLMFPKEVENVIQSMNKAITANPYSYKIVDTYTIFNNDTSGKPLTNIMKDLDPHPNEFGHNLIYIEHLKLLGIN